MRLADIYRAHGIQFNWNTSLTPVRGFGLLPQSVPNFLYEPPTTPGRIGYDPMLDYRKELQRVEEEFLDSLSDHISRMFSKEFVKVFSLEQIEKVAKNLDKIAKKIKETAQTTNEQRITRERKAYAVHAKYKAEQTKKVEEKKVEEKKISKKEAKAFYKKLFREYRCPKCGTILDETKAVRKAPDEKRCVICPECKDEVYLPEE